VQTWSAQQIYAVDTSVKLQRQVCGSGILTHTKSESALHIQDSHGDRAVSFTQAGQYPHNLEKDVSSGLTTALKLAV
jgi:hypothetical protein